MKARIAGGSVVGAGFDDWEHAQEILGGRAPWNAEARMLPSPSILSANERRRVSPAVRLALCAAEEACQRSGVPRDSMECVFASALGDGSVTHAILNALRMPQRVVSPTHFHNSVHNATAGYWSIGARNHQASTSLAAGDASFGAALLKALMTVSVEGKSVELVVVEHPLPEPLASARPIGSSLAVALVLVPPAADHDGPMIELVGPSDGPATPPTAIDVASLWDTSPAGRALTVVEAVSSPGRIVVETGEGYFLALDVVGAS